MGAGLGFTHVCFAPMCLGGRAAAIKKEQTKHDKNPTPRRHPVDPPTHRAYGYHRKGDTHSMHHASWKSRGEGAVATAASQNNKRNATTQQTSRKVKAITRANRDDESAASVPKKEAKTRSGRRGGRATPPAAGRVFPGRFLPFLCFLFFFFSLFQVFVVSSASLFHRPSAASLSPPT